MNKFLVNHRQYTILKAESIMMELIFYTGSLILAVYFLLRARDILRWVWFNPRKLEKHLRQHGFNGNSYRFLFGDSKEMGAMSTEALSKPMNMSNDIVPRLMPFVHHNINKYGGNSFVWFGPKAFVFISDPEMIKEILAKHYIFRKMENPFDKLLARGLAAYEAEKWVKHRKLINPAFHMEKLKNMVPSFYLSCSDMLSKWEKIVPIEGSAELDIWPHLKTLTSDAISRTAFGSNFEEGRRVFELQKEQGALLLNALQMFYIPAWRFLPTKANRRMKAIKKEVESCILGIIEKRMRGIEAGEASSDDLLGILLESNYKEIQDNGTESGMSLEDVMEECKLFYLAGQETTSSLLVWTMILLAKHSDWQARARDEVLQVVGNEKPEFQQINHLKVVNMILCEVMRLYPPAIMLTRTPHEETSVKNVTFPTGLQIFLPAILLQHDCKIWGDDAKEFNPERFSEGIFKATKGQLTYLPFGNGPRTCIGQNFAMLEAKMAIAMILLRYSFELSPSYAHTPEVVLILQPQKGAQLMIRRVYH